MIKFEVGKKYTGTGVYGDCDMLVLKRTLKTIQFETPCGIFKARIKDLYQDRESVSHRAWLYVA